MRRDRLLLLIVLALLSVGGSLAIASSSIGDKTTKHSSRCFDTNLATPVPDLSQDTLTAYTLNYIDFFNFPDPTITSDPACGDLTLTVVGSGGPAGLAVVNTNKKVPIYTGTITAGASSGTITYSVDNANSATTSDTAAYTVTAVAGSGTPIATGAASRFVKPTGNDALDGLTPANAWRTINKVNVTVLPAGTDVWFEAGGTFNDAAVNVDWAGVGSAGVATNRVVIGTYYMSGGAPFELMPDDLLGNAQDNSQGWSNGARAKIHGSYVPACRSSTALVNGHVQCLVGPGATPSGGYSALFHVGRPYVTVQSLEIAHSAGRGMVVTSRGITGAPYPCFSGYPGFDLCKLYTIVQYNNMHHANGLVFMIDGATYTITRGNEWGYAGIGQPDGYNRLCPTANDCAPDGGVYSFRSDPAHWIIENNWVHDMWNESITPTGSSYLLIAGNRMASNQRAGIYTDGSADVVAEANIAARGPYRVEPGLGNPSIVPFFPNGAFVIYALIKEAGSTTAGQAAQGARRSLYRNNLASTAPAACLDLSIALDTGAPGASGGHFGSTCIGVATQAGLYMDGVPPDPLLAEVKNNIFATTTGAAGCFDTIASTPYLLVGENFWTGTPASGCQGSGDVYGTWAGLALTSSFAHGSSSADNFPTIDDFRIANTSTAATGGEDLSAAYIDTTAWAWEIANRTWYPSCATGLASTADWAKKNAVDYCNKARSYGSRGALNRNP